MDAIPRPSRPCDALGAPVALPQHHYEHCPERPVLLAVDQELREGAIANSRGTSRRARHKPALASEPLPSRIDEQREHHQPRDNGYLNRDSLPRQHPAR